MNPDLLDTNTCVQYLRGRDKGLTLRLQARSADQIRLCSVVVAGLYYGAYHGNPTHTAKNLGSLALFLPRFLSLPFTDDCAVVCGRIRADLASRGAMIGPYDLQIAAIALVHGLTLVTHNTREFAHVPGLILDDWETTP